MISALDHSSLDSRQLVLMLIFCTSSKQRRSHKLLRKPRFLSASLCRHICLLLKYLLLLLNVLTYYGAIINQHLVSLTNILLHNSIPENNKDRKLTIMRKNFTSNAPNLAT